ncbi:hypothetical protein BD779DRAFT_1797918, partial [Infundibulicybe gibba]
MRFGAAVFSASVVLCLLGPVAGRPPTPENQDIDPPQPKQLVFGYFSLPFNLQRFLPSWPDFWDEAQNLGQRAGNYVESELEKQSERSKEIAQKVSEFKEAMRSLVNSTEHLRHTALESIAREHGVSLRQISEKMSIELNATLTQLQLEFSEGEGSPGYDRRVLMVDRALELSDDALIKTFDYFNIPADKTQQHLDVIKPHVRHLVLATGNFVDAHPQALELVLFSAAIMLIPESLILRPILGLFGFGPSGPLKRLNSRLNSPWMLLTLLRPTDSAASWAQRRFFGAFVEKGSWFARLQAAGMTAKLPAIRPILGGVGLGL